MKSWIRRSKWGEYVIWLIKFNCSCLLSIIATSASAYIIIEWHCVRSLAWSVQNIPPRHGWGHRCGSHASPLSKKTPERWSKRFGIKIVPKSFQIPNYFTPLPKSFQFLECFQIFRENKFVTPPPFPLPHTAAARSAVTTSGGKPGETMIKWVNFFWPQKVTSPGWTGNVRHVISTWKWK